MLEAVLRFETNSSRIPAAEPTRPRGPADTGPQPQRARRRRSPGLVAALGSVGLFIVVAARNRASWRLRVTLEGDAAANAILIDQAKHLRLVVGNYSRVRFNHPGPALLYVQAAGEVVFRDLLHVAASPYGGHVLAIIILACSLAGVTAWLVGDAVGSGVASLAVLLGVCALGVMSPSLLSSTWMPDVYVMPFLLFAVSGALLAIGRWRALCPYVVAASLLVHGHVSFVLFTGVGTAAIVGALGWRERGRWRRTLREHRRRLQVAAALLGLFVSPIVIHTLASWPGELDKYLGYSSSETAGGHTLGDVVGYAARYWGPEPVSGTIVAGLSFGVTVALALTARRRRMRTTALSLASAAILAEALVLVYASRGIDDLTQRYIVRFAITIPVVLAVAAAVSLSRRALVPVPAVLTAGTVAVLLAALALTASDNIVNPYRGGPWLPAATAAVMPGGGRPAVLRFEHEQWPVALGILETAHKSGQDACIADPGWEFMVTRERLCDARELSAGQTVQILAATVEPKPGTRILYTSPSGERFTTE